MAVARQQHLGRLAAVPYPTMAMRKPAISVQKKTPRRARGPKV